MARSKRKGKKDGAVLATDDRLDESSSHVPDPNSDDFIHDEVDQFHANQNKILLDQGASLGLSGPASDEEEILGVGADSGDDDAEIAKYEKQLHKFRSQGFKDDLASDIEEDNDDLDEKAWGKTASDFYGTDIHDDNLGYLSASDGEVDAVLEEKEALAIQRRLTAQLDQQDLALDLFQPLKKSSAPVEGEKITKDLSKLSRKEKLKLLKKESPELLGIVEEFKAKLTELQDRLMPIYTLIKARGLPVSKGAIYVKTKISLYLNYCVNLNHYLTLKATHTSVVDHPVVSRIVQYRNLMVQLDAVDASYRGEMDYILQQLSSNKDVQLQSEQPLSIVRKDRSRLVSARPASKPQKRKLTELVSDMSSSEDEAERKAEEKLDKGGRTWGRKKATPDPSYETRDEKKALEYYAMLKAGKKPSEIKTTAPERAEPSEEDAAGELPGEEEGEAGDDDDERRAINYKISKNKGLTPKRKKENRNPRVKNKLKYQKAIKRRKGQVRAVRKELKPYGGELSGIRAGVKKSVKFKG